MAAKEIILGDTSYVSVCQRLDARNDTRTWPRATAGRIKAAKVFVSVVTCGEVRAGILDPALSRHGADDTQRWLDRFPLVDVDVAIAHSYSDLDIAERARGRIFSENDLWIAATAQSLGVPVVTCDKAFLDMEHLDVEVIYLPASVPAEVTGTR